MTASPLFSILIPARNRPLLTQLAVESALSAHDDVEVVVSDNSDHAISLPEHPRVRVLRGPQVLSMPANWERCVQAARGEWVVLQSDKYRLVPGALAALQSLAGERRVVTYQHAILEQRLAEGEGMPIVVDAPGELSLGAAHAGELRNCRETLAAWYRTVAYDPSRPMLYSALVHRSVIERIRRRSSKTFVGMAPDVASSLQLLSACSEYLATPLVGLVVHLPWRAPDALSNGYSLATGGPLARTFLGEFADQPLARYGLPELGASVIFETLLEFARQHPELVSETPPSWEAYVREATLEVAFSPRKRRHELLLALLGAGRRHRTGASIARSQVGALVHYAHRRLAGTARWQQVRQVLCELGMKVPVPSVAPTRVANLADALERCRTVNAQRMARAGVRAP